MWAEGEGAIPHFERPFPPFLLLSRTRLGFPKWTPLFLSGPPRAGTRKAAATELDGAQHGSSRTTCRTSSSLGPA